MTCDNLTFSRLYVIFTIVFEHNLFVDCNYRTSFSQICITFFCTSSMRECCKNLLSTNKACAVRKLLIHLQRLCSKCNISFIFRRVNVTSTCWTYSTNIDRRDQNLRYLYSGMELQLGVFGFFPRSK